MSSRICKTTKAHGEGSTHKFRRFTALSSRKSKQKLQFWLDGIFRPRKGRGITSSGFRLPHSKAIRFSILVLFVVAGVALSIAPFSRIERFALPRATGSIAPRGGTIHWRWRPQKNQRIFWCDTHAVGRNKGLIESKKTIINTKKRPNMHQQHCKIISWEVRLKKPPINTCGNDISKYSTQFKTKHQRQHKENLQVFTEQLKTENKL